MTSPLDHYEKADDYLRTSSGYPVLLRAIAHSLLGILKLQLEQDPRYGGTGHG